MGAFFLLHKDCCDNYPTTCASLDKTFVRQGFSVSQIVDAPQYRLHVYSKRGHETDNFCELSNGDFGACTGTFLYQGSVGHIAIKAFLGDFSPDKFGLLDTRGDFCLIIRKAGVTYLMIDDLGIYKVYVTEDRTLWSSSFLTAVDGLHRVTLDKQACYEYVFYGATFGGDTVASGIKQLAGRTLYNVARAGGDRESGLAIPKPASRISFDECVEKSLAELREYFDTIANCFGSSITTALSGGYDSRLTLALLIERNVTPEVYVYGRDEDSDVQIAKEVDRHENLDLRHIDKTEYERVRVDDFPSNVEENFHAFDGFPVDESFGSIIDLKSRLDRTKGNVLQLNGGGGEVFRNFYYLPDKPLTIRDFLFISYSKFDRNCCTEFFSEDEFMDSLGRKIRLTLKTDSDALSRTQAEFLYPGFRCRFWMGRNNSLNNRFGYTLTPFIDPKIVITSLKIPFRFKDFGVFEAELIRRVSPNLARYTSSYGHAFDKRPPFRRMLKDTAKKLRPPFVRKLSLQARSRRSADKRPYYWTEPYLRAVFPSGLDYTRRLFMANQIKDSGQLNRLALLEYFSQRVNACW